MQPEDYAAIGFLCIVVGTVFFVGLFVYRWRYNKRLNKKAQRLTEEHQARMRAWNEKRRPS